MSYNKEEMAAMAGESSYRRPAYLNVPEVQLQGTRGVFELSAYDPKTQKYTKSDLGEELRVVLLRKRRRLASYDKKTKVWMKTSEHNTADDPVILNGTGGLRQKGTAAAIRAEHEDLRTNELFYGLLPKIGLVKVLFKGSSLGSENKPEDSIPLYDYLKSFGEAEHIWEFVTILKPFPESGPLGKYFAISSERGEQLTEDKIEKLVVPEMKKISDNFKQLDAYYGANVPAKVFTKKDRDPLDDIPIVDLDAEGAEGRPEDIPF